MHLEGRKDSGRNGALSGSFTASCVNGEKEREGERKREKGGRSYKRKRRGDRKRTKEELRIARRGQKAGNVQQSRLYIQTRANRYKRRRKKKKKNEENQSLLLPTCILM